ncbi:Alpha/beta superfamily hydrolase [Deinococcus phoenicis]|uniref:Alpha/beta superfamily hydrolase n=1 Tax=Deinococcus phoenicis TaxID=1476583 RepID=A0A016QRR2_9DEIO|nr:alpha/beta hydrolase [Deinococcus phoenicis]EYB68469.1 Alpha/beta superfamily hydrolase [Deinococcus phoenicis]
MTPTLVIVPGLGDSGPDHWQTLWEQKFGAARVRQDDPSAPAPESWAARLQEVIEATPGELVLAGHSCGVLNIVHWARLYGGHERVRGALLVGPTDADCPEMAELAPPVLLMAPVPMQPLPFPALVVASEDDPYVTFERAQAMADAWEAEFVTAGAAGHINAASGHGAWPDGEVLLSEALHAWTPPEITRF